MKICLLLPFFSIVSILSIVFPEASVYLSPWLNFVESIAMGSFFLLLCEFVSESQVERDVFFAALVVVDKGSKRAKNGQRGGLPWYRVCSLSVVHVGQRVNTMIETLGHDIPISCRFPFDSDYYKHNSSCR